MHTLDSLDWPREKRGGTGLKGNSRLGPNPLSFLRRFSRTFCTEVCSSSKRVKFFLLPVTEQLFVKQATGVKVRLHVSNILFILFRLSEIEEELLEQNNLTVHVEDARSYRNMIGWLNGFNCGLRSVHPISTDILNYAILSTLKDSRTGLVLCLYFLKWNSILKQEIYSSQRAQFRCVLLAPTTLLSDRHQQPTRLKMLKRAAKFRIFPFHLLIPVLVKEKWL